MRNLLVSLALLIVSAGVAYAQSQPGNPYAPGSFMNDTLLYNAIISNDTDAYLNQRQPPPYFVLPSTQAVPSTDLTEYWAERSRAETRAMEADTARRNRQLDRDLAEIRHQELLNAIDRRR